MTQTTDVLVHVTKEFSYKVDASQTRTLPAGWNGGIPAKAAAQLKKEKKGEVVAGEKLKAKATKTVTKPATKASDSKGGDAGETGKTNGSQGGSDNGGDGSGASGVSGENAAENSGGTSEAGTSSDTVSGA